MIYIGLASFCIAALLILTVLWRTRPDDGAGSDGELAMYKDQLRSLDKDKARGVVDDSEYDALRAEIGRRILGAARTNDGGRSGSGSSPLVWAGLSVASLAGAIAIYLSVGQPGFSDQPIQARFDAADTIRADRPSQTEAEAEITLPAREVDEDYTALVTRLRTALETRPDDLRGLRLLVQAEARLGNFKNAYTTQTKVIELQGDAAPAADWSRLSELLIAATQGYISPEAEVALRGVLLRDPDNGLARFRMGALHEQTGRPDRTFRIWAALLAEGPESAPYIPAIRATIEDLALQAGNVKYTPPAPAPGPSAEDIAAAEEMTAADRQAMIEGMVAGLADRLGSEGGTAQEWARLIGALGVLGRTEQAQAIYNEAKSIFAADQDGFAVVQAAAQSAGLTL